VLADGDLLAPVSQALDDLTGYYDVTVDKDVKACIAYALEDKNVSPEEVPALFRHFLMSPELRECIQYNRKPTPRDILDVWHRKGPSRYE
jgi:hypothetical protein